MILALTRFYTQMKKTQENCSVICLKLFSNLKEIKIKPKMHNLQMKQLSLLGEDSLDGKKSPG